MRKGVRPLFLKRFKKRGQTPFLKLIGRMAEELGYKAYLVGGPVRDLLLGKEIVDIDITVEGDAIELGRRIAAKFKKKIVAHPKFGTCTIVDLKGYSVDLATARKESYARPAAFPDVEPSTLKDDLFRRDFTINAMAMSINKPDFGCIVDYFGGRRALDKNIIRVLHNKSFIDDPTRIFRAVRFAKRLGFGIERHTEKFILEAIGREVLDLLDTQRVRKEVLLILKEKKTLEILECLARLYADGMADHEHAYAKRLIEKVCGKANRQGEI